MTFGLPIPTDDLVFSLPQPKTCAACGKVYTTIPKWAKHSDDPDFGGWFWECDGAKTAPIRGNTSCNSTLFVCDPKTEKKE